MDMLPLLHLIDFCKTGSPPPHLLKLDSSYLLLIALPLITSVGFSLHMGSTITFNKTFS